MTTPPFLDVVDYKADNWMRVCFNNIEIVSLGITQLSSIESWTTKMLEVFLELFRVVKPSGYVAFEVGAQKLKMEELVIPIAQQTGFKVEKVLINTQEFTKTVNCWGVSNQAKGTNTNRIALLKK